MKNVPEEIFRLLDTWRHFPAYQLERRADIFFAIYLQEVLEAKYDVPFEEPIPEFPIRIGTIEQNNSNQSFKADYLAVSETLDQAILIELKTDMDSIRPEQTKYLKRAKGEGLKSLLEGLIRLYGATAAKEKYWQLIRHIEDLKLLTISKEVSLSGATNAMPPSLEVGRNVHINKDPALEIVYVQPNPQKDVMTFEKVITFDEFTDIVASRYDDEFSKRFVQSLRRWRQSKAGFPGE